MRTLKLPHRKILEAYISAIKSLSKEKRKELGIPYNEARSLILKKAGFKSDYEFDRWRKFTLSKFDETESCDIRNLALNTKPKHYKQSQYYYFSSDIDILIDEDLEISPKLAFMPRGYYAKMSVWTREGESKDEEYRVASHDVNAELVYEKKTSVYVISSEYELAQWLFRWGGDILIDYKLKASLDQLGLLKPVVA